MPSGERTKKPPNSSSSATAKKLCPSFSWPAGNLRSTFSVFLFQFNETCVLSPSMEVEEKWERLVVFKRPVLGHVESVGARYTTLGIK